MLTSKPASSVGFPIPPVSPHPNALITPEIQELRHQSGVSSQNANTHSSEDSPRSSNESSRIIDQALINLDERLESISRNIQSIDETLVPLLRSAVKTPTQNTSQNVDEASKMTLRKHAAIIQEWESIQNEAEVLREELKEDKWLTVFRSVSEQADGMMKSLEKAVSQCQVIMLSPSRSLF